MWRKQSVAKKEHKLFHKCFPNAPFVSWYWVILLLIFTLEYNLYSNHSGSRHAVTFDLNSSLLADPMQPSKQTWKKQTPYLSESMFIHITLSHHELPVKQETLDFSCICHWHLFHSNILWPRMHSHSPLCFFLPTSAFLFSQMKHCQLLQGLSYFHFRLSTFDY